MFVRGHILRFRLQMDESKIVFSSSYSESDFKIMQLEPDVVDSMQRGES